MDLVKRLTREEKINLVTRADTGFLPRLNLKEFKFFNTCLHGWWTSNVTTFGMRESAFVCKIEIDTHSIHIGRR
jgi:hypothetical protein